MFLMCSLLVHSFRVCVWQFEARYRFGESNDNVAQLSELKASHMFTHKFKCEPVLEGVLKPRIGRSGRGNESLYVDNAPLSASPAPPPSRRPSSLQDSSGHAPPKRLIKAWNLKPSGHQNVDTPGPSIWDFLSLKGYIFIPLSREVSNISVAGDGNAYSPLNFQELPL